MDKIYPRVEIFEANDNKYHLAVEPRTAVRGLAKHLSDEMGIKVGDSPVVGDFCVDLSEKDKVQDVLNGVAVIVAHHRKS